MVDGRHHAHATCWGHDLTLHTIPLRNNLAPLGILPRLIREGGSCTPLSPFRLGSGASVSIKFQSEYTIKCTCRPEAYCRHGFPVVGILRWARTDATGKPSVTTPEGSPVLTMMSQGTPVLLNEGLPTMKLDSVLYWLHSIFADSHGRHCARKSSKTKYTWSLTSTSETLNSRLKYYRRFIQGIVSATLSFQTVYKGHVKAHMNSDNGDSTVLMSGDDAGSSPDTEDSLSSLTYVHLDQESPDVSPPSSVYFRNFRGIPRPGRTFPRQSQ